MTQSAQIILISAIFSSLVATGIVSGILYTQPQLYQQKIAPQQTITNQNEPVFEELKVSTATNQKIENLEQKITELQKNYATLLENQSQLKSPAKNSTTQTTQLNQTQNPSFTNQVIYLGSATTNHRDWTKTGVEVTLNSAEYPQGTQARFEAGLKIIGGEASARLINKTTGAIISITEVSHNTNTTTWKGSTPFKLHSGTNIYAVELRSSSGETAELDGSRIILEK